MEIENREKICASTCTMWGDGIWLHHPADNALVLFVDKMAIRSFKWDSLAEVDLASDGDSQELDPDYRELNVSGIDGIARAITVGERHVVFQATWAFDVAFPIIMTGR